MGFGNSQPRLGQQPSFQPAPPYGQPQGGQQGGGPLGGIPSWVGPTLTGLGAIYGAYTQNQNANKNFNAQQAHNQAIADAAGHLSWGDGLSGQDILGQIANGSMGQPKQINLGSMLGNDGLMQLLRANPANSALQQMVTNGGNPFDSSQLLSSLGAVDQANTQQQVSGLRAGFAGLGQRFGSAAAGAEGSLRQGIARDTNARNAGIVQGGYEAGQGRVLQAASQLGGNTQNALSTLLQIAGLNQGAAQQGVQNQLGAISQLYGQQLGQHQYNANLLGITAGLNPAQINAPGYGGAIGDIGQLLTFLPLLMGR